jgi:hypothetical protein
MGVGIGSESSTTVFGRFDVADDFGLLATLAFAVTARFGAAFFVDFLLVMNPPGGWL